MGVYPSYWQWRSFLSLRRDIFSPIWVYMYVARRSAKRDPGSHPVVTIQITTRHEMPMLAVSRAAAKIGNLLNVKYCILAKFWPENIFHAKSKREHAYTYQSCQILLYCAPPKIGHAISR